MSGGRTSGSICKTGKAGRNKRTGECEKSTYEVCPFAPHRLAPWKLKCWTLNRLDSTANQYQLYPRPDTPSCDAFLWLMLWIKWVEYMHLGRPMAGTDFMFPMLSTNGVLHPGQPLSHEMVQKLLNEVTAEAGVPGTFLMHCFRRGGVQYCFMLAPKPWLLKRFTGGQMG